MMRLGLAAVLCGVVVASGCALEDQTAPPLGGPSGLGLNVTITASPEILQRDGSSMSTISVNAVYPDRPFAGHMLLSASAGTLSTTEVVTTDGKATFDYTAPDVNQDVSSVTIYVTPVEPKGDAANSRSSSVRLAVIGPSVPVARFTPPVTPPAILDTVTFNASGSTIDGIACKSACTYAWNFGDGSTDTGLAVQHQFKNSGVFNVTLTVTFTAAGTSASVTEPVIISPPASPVAEFTFGVCATPAARCVRFTDASTVGAGATIAGYLWDFGDSTSPVSTTPVEHTYAAAGTYNVKLTVTDSLGRVSKATTKPVTVP